MSRSRDIAIIGLDCRFPGARDPETFWENLKKGVESISFLTKQELAASGVGRDLLENPQYVPARSLLDDVDLFDAEFFGYSPKEAEAMDPQQRVFLETAWRALEQAGYVGEKYDGAIGVFAGAYLGTYLLANLCADREFIESLLNFKRVGAFQTFLGNDKDYLTSRVAYKLNLRGPAVTIQTACSTSLVAICQACQSLLQGQCDMALAGGVTITFPQKKGYLYQEGGMLSPDGHCRAFDAKAQGTVFGSGIGLVVLKRLTEAIADGDNIYAVIKGSALNNDGAVKVSYTAPSVNGQAEVIALAQALAGVSADTITYVEAHGTATPLGDPIEIAGLTQAFRQTTNRHGFCAIGSVKSNIGHLDVAAGVAGLIKTTLALHHKVLPPTLHFTEPNPQIDFAHSPFYVNTQLSEWRVDGHPRRAGISSFGVGGTNAHVVLEEAPPVESSGPSRPWQLLTLSARNNKALEAAAKNLAVHLQTNAQAGAANLADVAFTLQMGRHDFAHRRTIVCRDAAEAVTALTASDPKRVYSRVQERKAQPVAFLFPGQGAQYVNMGIELYQTENVFREEIDRCAEILRPKLELDLRDVLYPRPDGTAQAEELLVQTRLTQPALFVVEYALARLWMSWGLAPKAMIGHSIGEYVAGCLAEVFSLESALELVATRARLVQAQPPGAMLAVRLTEKEVLPLLPPELSIAAINAPDLCVISGPFDAMKAFEGLLANKDLSTRRLKTSHAFHSAMMDPVIAPLAEILGHVSLRPPTLPYVSTVTGEWIEAGQATDPQYWAAHGRRPVRFAQAVSQLFKDPNLILLEVGPGQTLATLARRHPGRSPEQSVLASFPVSAGEELRAMLTTLGQLWLGGASPDWKKFYVHERRRRVALPTYPFERTRHWVSPPASAAGSVELPCASAPPPSVACGQAEHASTSKQSPPMSEIQQPTNSKRQEQILAKLRTLLHELSGIDLAQTDPSATFLELGFDSLFLTQARQSLQNVFNVRITYRQLMDELPSVAAVAAHIDKEMPPEPAAPMLTTPPSEDPATSSTVEAGSGSGAVGSSATAATIAASLDSFVAATSVARGPSSDADSKVAGTNSLERVLIEQMHAISRLAADQLALLREAQAGATSSKHSTTVPPNTNKASESLPSQNGHSPKTAPTSSGATPSTAGATTVESKSFGPYRVVQRRADNSFTARQRAWLEAFTRRYTARTARSKKSAQEQRRHLADPRAIAGFNPRWKDLVYQIIADRALGSRLWDIDGHEYIDVTMGFGVNLFGHSPPFVMKAANEQLQAGIPIGPQSPLAAEVAALIREFTGAERVTFCNTGSEAVLAALRVARTTTGRNKIAFFSGDYHGMFDEVLLRPVNANGNLRSVPVAPGIPPQAGADVWILDYGSSASLEILRAHANELAAVLVEPVQSRHPDLQPKEFLHELRTLTQRSGTVLIFDEVITGFRVAPGGAQAIFGVQPDVTTYGKVIGGGFPIGVLAGKAACLDALDGGDWQFGDDSVPEADMTFFAGTFVRHPLALAAAKASLLHLQERGPALQAELNQRTDEMVKGIDAIMAKYRCPIHVMHFGSLFRFHFPADWAFAPLFIYQMLEKGIYLREAHQNCFLSTAHTPTDIQRVLTAIDETMASLGEGDLLPIAQSSPSGAPTGSTSSESSDAGGGPLGDRSKRHDATVNSSEGTSTDLLPLTESQKEIWLGAQLGSSASCAFNESFTAELNGPLNIDVLRQSLADVVARHDALRTVLDPNGESQRFVPITELKIEVPLVDLSELEEPKRARQLAELYAQQAAKALDLLRAPLWQAQLVKVEDQRHLFIFKAHHIICDGWSSSVVLGELGQFYSARQQGQELRLERAHQFEEFVQEQARSQTSAAGKADEAWWLEQFLEPVPLLELPADHADGSTRVAQAGTERGVLSGELLQKLQRAAAGSRVTLFALLFGAFNILLHRLSQQEEFAVGIFSSGQSRLGWDDLIGHCVNMLPVRTRLKEGATVQEYLQQIKRVLLDVQDHENYTYGQLLQKLTLSRSADRAPLVQAVFNLERQGDEGAHFHGLEMKVDQNPHAFVLFDLFLNIRATSDRLNLDLEYNASRFTEATARRWLGHFETLLKAIVHDLEARVDDLPLLSDAEYKQIVIDWNPPLNQPAREACLHALFEAQVQRTPDSTAVIHNAERWTYRQLDDAAETIATRLRTAGVESESLVGLCTERSPLLIAGVLGILKAGAAYVPLDPAYPRERLAFILTDSAARVLLTTRNLSERLDFNQPPSTTVLFLDDDRDAHRRSKNPRFSAPSKSADNDKVSARNRAYVIYTSGSTGRPKGVAIEHRQAAAFIDWAHTVFSAQELAGVLASTSVCFDLSVFEMFVPLTCGGAVILAGNILALPELPARQEVTLINSVPSAMNELLRLKAVPASVRTINLAGEPLTRSLVKRLYELPGVEKVYDLYGPSESTTYSTFALRDPNGPATIGRPIAGTQVYILDARQHPTPIGVPGEIFIGGAGLARGYLHRPELTAEKFVPNPFADDPNERLYRTGDRARYFADGNIEFLGRTDQQIKLRGFRIELGEIENTLRQHPRVEESVVIVRKDDSEAEQLVGYVIPRATEAAEEVGLENAWVSDVASQFECGYSAAIREATGPSSPTHDPTLNIYGWSGLEKTDQEVTRWVDDIASRVLRFRPQRLLEIGCGTGLVLSRLAPEVGEYWATDLSRAAIEHLEERVRAVPELQRRVKLRCQPANDFEGLPAKSFDGVILNAVLEYFPSVDYLLKVLKGITSLVKPGGFVFLGAVPNYSVQELFHVWEQLGRAAKIDDSTSILARASNRLDKDPRLLVAPEFFLRLGHEVPEISEVRFQILADHFENEASRLIADTYYDVFLKVGAPRARSEPTTWLDWEKDELDLAKVKAALAEHPEKIGIRGVPHERMQRRWRALDLLNDSEMTVGALLGALAPADSGNLLPQLVRLGKDASFHAEVAWSDNGVAGKCDVFFHASDQCDPGVPASTTVNEVNRTPNGRSLGSWVSNPLHAKLASELVPELRTFLQGKLPDYMVPTAFVLLNELPWTPNGKLDRRALPAPRVARRVEEQISSVPQSPAEVTLAGIWCDVLKVKQVSTRDNFFDLGGHSLLVTQVVARIRDAFQVNLPIRTLFEHPTIGGTAAAIEKLLVEQVQNLSDEEAARLAGITPNANISW